MIKCGKAWKEVMTHERERGKEGPVGREGALVGTEREAFADQKVLFQFQSLNPF